MTQTQISAVASNNGATISGTGTKDLATGTNLVTLTVKGPSGGTKKYTVRIRKLADTTATPNQIDTSTPEPTPEETNMPELLRLTYLRIEDVELVPEFDSECFEYSVSVTNINNLDITALANDDSATVEVIGGKDLVEGSNEVVVRLTRTSNNIENTEETPEPEVTEYRITVNKTVIDVVLNNDEGSPDNSNFLGSTTAKIVVGAVAIIALGGAGFAIWHAKSADRGFASSRREAKKRASFDNFDD